MPKNEERMLIQGTSVMLLAENEKNGCWGDNQNSPFPHPKIIWYCI